jgi:coiled-coil domain-containing protein 12
VPPSEEKDPVEPEQAESAVLRPALPTDSIKRELQALGQPEEINIVPKKANWDLKNMLAKKTERLQRRTQLAIVDLLRERLGAQQDEDEEQEQD